MLNSLHKFQLNKPLQQPVQQQIQRRQRHKHRQQHSTQIRRQVHKLHLRILKIHHHQQIHRFQLRLLRIQHRDHRRLRQLKHLNRIISRFHTLKAHNILIKHRIPIVILLRITMQHKHISQPLGHSLLIILTIPISDRLLHLLFKIMATITDHPSKMFSVTFFHYFFLEYWQ